VGLFDPEQFAQWMTDGYEHSTFKSIRSLAAAAHSNPATISRLMNAAPQTNTDRPSQPKPDLVERLAKLFNKDVNEALILAGHAPKNSADDTYDILDGARVSFDHRKFTKAEQEQLLDAMRLIAAGIKARKTPES
jgi:hypothetical protein